MADLSYPNVIAHVCLILGNSLGEFGWRDQAMLQRLFKTEKAPALERTRA